MANPKKISILIENPASGGSGYTSLAHARRMVKLERANWCADGRLHLITVSESRKLRSSVNLPKLVFRPQHETTRDARSGLPVLPPSSAWFQRMGYARAIITG